MSEIADFCKECQRNHIKSKGWPVDKKNKVIKKWPVECKGIQKDFFDSCKYNEETEEVEIGYYDLLQDLSEDEYLSLPDEEKIRLQYSNNPLLFAKNELGWTPYNPNRSFYQFYQKEFLLCTAKNKVGRFSRRLGKTEIICVKSLNFICTSIEPAPSVLILVPFDTLASEIHNRLIAMSGGRNSKLDSKKIKTRKQPYYEVAYYREDTEDIATVRIFTTGAKSGGGATSVRGQRAHLVLIDEEAYLHPDDYGAIVPLKEENKNVEIWGFSTPSALHNQFKEKCLKNPEFKDFWYPYDVLRPLYGEEDFENRVNSYIRMLGYAKYMLEFRAEFYEEDSKVFKVKYITAAGSEYHYYDRKLPFQDHLQYTIGVDWNSWKNGVNIAVHEYDSTTGNSRLCHKLVLDGDTFKESSQQLQTTAIIKIMELVESFDAVGLAVDAGYGSMQCEILTVALSKVDKSDILDIVDFSQFTEIYNPLDPSYPIKQKNKPLLVHLMQQRLEEEKFQYSTYEEGNLSQADNNKKGLPYQLDTYEISKYDSHGHPVFVSPCDHFLDANMLANYSIAKKLVKLFVMDIAMAMAGNIKNVTTKTTIEDVVNEIIKNPTGPNQPVPFSTTKTERNGKIGEGTMFVTEGNYGVFAKPSSLRKGRLR